MKQMMMMLHGWGFPGAVFSPLIERLATDFDVSAPDRAGYGNSNDSAADAAADSPLLLLGWSLGGMRALQMAKQQPQRVSGLILLATTPCFVRRDGWSSAMDAAIFDGFRKLVEDDPAAAMQQFIRLNAGSRPDRQTMSLLTDHSDKVTVEALQQGMAELAETDIRKTIPEIKQPVLLLHAVDDRVVPVSAGRWLQQNLVNARSFEFDSGGHAFFLQHADAVAGHIRAMI